jgi:septum formation protein
MAGAGVWVADAPVVLASTSRVRRTLLEAAGIPVDAVSSGVDERAIEASLGPGIGATELAVRLARAKAQAVGDGYPDRIVIGADQVLELEGACLGKPGTPHDARRQIARLAGRTHILQSAVAIVVRGRVEAVEVESAKLTMRNLDAAAIAAYVEAAGESATRSAGGYEIEGLGIHLFSDVEGEHSTILGLPLLPVLAALRRLDCLAL